jgi:2',3'-cyclic-nucleotide 2'-phosphodiesterase (5'-nucleotidase family)
MKIKRQPLQMLYFLLFLTFFYNCGLRRKMVTVNNINLYYSIKPPTKDSNETIPELVEYRSKMEQLMNVRIGHTFEELKKAKPNSTLGNMVSDAMYLEAKKMDTNVVAAVANYGGIRIPFIAIGDISLGKVFEVMPFDNTLCTINLSGALADTLCQYIARSGGWPISNFSFELINNKADNIFINGARLNYNNHYTFALNDYIANGGDNCKFLVPLPKKSNNVLVRDAIINYIKECDVKKKSLVLSPLKRIQ